jgi:plasmid replication initiation protein
LNTRVIEQARKELTAKASITFRPKAQREGRKTVGWFFEIKDNKPKHNRVAGAIELPETAKRAEAEQFDTRISSAKARWEQATEAQRKKLLSQMDSVASTMAPQNGAEPRKAFLLCLVSLLEPELPLV